MIGDLYHMHVRMRCIPVQHHNFFILHTPGVPLSKDNIFVSCNESLIEFLWVIIAFFMFLDQLLWSHFDTNVSKKQNEVGMA